MSLRKKIVLGFLICPSFVAVLILFAYLNFIEMWREIRYLELSDTIRSKTLQIRRHEKNYFLYRDPKELEGVYTYLTEMRVIIREGHAKGVENLQRLNVKVDEYGEVFNRIEKNISEFQLAMSGIKESSKESTEMTVIYQLIEATILERPLINAEVLQNISSLPDDHPAIKSLRGLHIEIDAIRKVGEELIAVSKDIDKSAREKVDRIIYLTQAEILVIFPLSLFIGLGVSLTISRSIVRRLNILLDAVEKRSQGRYSYLSGTKEVLDKDEIDTLIRRFNYMEEQLKEKEEELIQSKKLVAIGRLASGIAHELNNPLNNIYTTAQRLMKKTGNECPEYLNKGLDEIFGQTLRVKRIVGELLEFARGREPNLKEVELNSFIKSAYTQSSNSLNTERINFSLESVAEQINITSDPEQMEQVFINLFNNAIEAMSGEGNLLVKTETMDDLIIVRVTDTGKGMRRETVEKIFEPFFTTKEKGIGLGLAIVYNIIRKHNGEIRAESEEGKGTTFTITLPASKKENGLKWD